MVVDWPAVRQGRSGVRAFLEDKEHPFFANHRWVLCDPAPANIRALLCWGPPCPLLLLKVLHITS